MLFAAAVTVDLGSGAESAGRNLRYLDICYAANGELEDKSACQSAYRASWSKGAHHDMPFLGVLELQNFATSGCSPLYTAWNPHGGAVGLEAEWGLTTANKLKC